MDRDVEKQNWEAAENSIRYQVYNLTQGKDMTIDLICTIRTVLGFFPNGISNISIFEVPK